MSPCGVGGPQVSAEGRILAPRLPGLAPDATIPASLETGMGGIIQPIFFGRSLCRSRSNPGRNPGLSAVPSLPPKADVAGVVERTVSALGYDPVDVERSSKGLLRVFIDRLPGQATAGETVTVDDCEKVTRQLQYVLEVEGIDYQRLEVSSPGLDRPLKRPADWERFVGARVEVTLREPFGGRRKFAGELQQRDGGWRLVMGESQKPARGRAAARRAAEPAAAPTVDALDFSLDEVREARLVPVLDFKGRSRQAAPAPHDGGPEQ